LVLQKKSDTVFLLHRKYSFISIIISIIPSNVTLLDAQSYTQVRNRDLLTNFIEYFFFQIKHQRLKKILMSVLQIESDTIFRVIFIL
jgi:hypothetical protein